MTWTTAQPSDSRVDYGVTDRYGLQAVASGQTTMHRAVLEDLTPGRQYFYRVGDYQGTFVAGQHFVIGPYLQHATETEMSVMCGLDAPMPMSVVYAADGETPDTIFVGEETHFQRVRLTGLKPKTTYRWFALAGGLQSQAGTFRTLGGAAVRFLLYGDSRGNPEVLAALARRMSNEMFDYVFHSGDFANDGRETDQWVPQYFEPTKMLSLKGAMFPALGNHEKDSQDYYRFFDVPSNGSAKRPEAWYRFVDGSVEYFVLDTNPESGMFEPGSEQRVWLENALNTSKALWKFVMCHHPVYSAGSRGVNTDFETRLLPILGKYGVDMMMAGHDHAYERTWPLQKGVRQKTGIIQVISGGGGAVLYPVKRDPRMAVAVATYHYCRVVVDGPRLDVDVFDINGKPLDAFSLHKEPAFWETQLALLSDGTPDQKAEAIHLLGRGGRSEAMSAFVGLAKQNDTRLRREVALSLSRMGVREGVKTLVPLSADPDAETRRYAVKGLADLGGKDVAHACLARLTDADSEVRRLAAEGLIHTPLPEASNALVMAIEDADARVRQAAATALGNLKDRASAEALKRALSDADVEVRRAAFEAIKGRNLSGESVTEMTKALTSPDVELQRDLAWILGEEKNAAAVPALIGQLKHEDEGVRRSVVIALGKIKHKDAVNPLIAQLDDSDKQVRSLAVRALQSITGASPGTTIDAWRAWKNK